MKKRAGPISRADAVHFLRGLGVDLADQIADVIEDKIAWRKGSKFSREKFDFHIAVFHVEHRARGVSVDAALREEAHALAERFDMKGPDDEETLRGYIIEARKEQRRRDRAPFRKLGK
jgi:hypothetical protein